MFFTEGSIRILVVKLKSAIRPLQENRVWGGFESFSETFFFLFVLFHYFAASSIGIQSQDTLDLLILDDRRQTAALFFFCISHIVLAGCQV